MGGDCLWKNKRGMCNKICSSDAQFSRKSSWNIYLIYLNTANCELNGIKQSTDDRSACGNKLKTGDKMSSQDALFPREINLKIYRRLVTR
jgi:hypothetical protein